MAFNRRFLIFTKGFSWSQMFLHFFSLNICMRGIFVNAMQGYILNISIIPPPPTYSTSFFSPTRPGGCKGGSFQPLKMLFKPFFSFFLFPFSLLFPHPLSFHFFPQQTFPPPHHHSILQNIYPCLNCQVLRSLGRRER